MSYKNVPDELKSLPQWVAFKIVDRGNGNKGKIPVNPKTGENAKANDPTTWGTYDQAITAVELYDLEGIGFEFANGIFGVDLDHVIDGSGNLTPEAKDIVDTLDSYTEYSPSGTGLHILCKGTIPEGDRRNGSVEMYGETRFFTVTGKSFGTPRKLAERTEAAAKVHKKYIYREQAQAATGRPGEVAEVTESDTDLLNRAFASARGSEIRKLWDGDTSGHNGDHSAADLALVRDLAYWTNGDASRIDRLFRSSGLMRDKWDRKTGSSTYGQNTIERVLKTFTPYTVQTPLKRITANGKVIYDADKQKEEAATMSPQTAPEPAQLTSAYDYLKANFKDDREQFKGYKRRKTGYENIDAVTGGLYPGLYVIGAQSSLGKTTFIHQMADQLAAAGDTVLFFSLEQSLFELTTKSLSRESFKDNVKSDTGAVSAIELRAGAKTQRVKDGYKNYMQYAKRVIIKECNFDENIESIEQTVKDYIKETGITPVVIIDYLQIIPALDPRMSDKEKTDQHMKRLKILQRNNNLVLFVISALNRANYLTQISFESFKESGGIEYTADVIWGMQYSIISTDPAFKSAAQGKVSEQRKKIQEAKTATPRKIELVCLKNRYGRDYSAYFLYYPKYDYFTQDIETEQINALYKPKTTATAKI